MRDGMRGPRGFARATKFSLFSCTFPPFPLAARQARALSHLGCGSARCIGPPLPCDRSPLSEVGIEANGLTPRVRDKLLGGQWRPGHKPCVGEPTGARQGTPQNNPVNNRTQY